MVTKRCQKNSLIASSSSQLLKTTTDTHTWLRTQAYIKHILLHGLEAFSLYNYELKSLDFVINRFFTKLFRTSNIHVVSGCQEQFNFVLPSVQLARRAEKFVNKLHVD